MIVVRGAVKTGNGNRKDSDERGINIGVQKLRTSAKSQTLGAIDGRDDEYHRTWTANPDW